MLTVGSLFAGIGGFDLGLERAGMRVVWQCESDEFCRGVLARHWPDVHCYADVRELVDAPYVDVLCGGFPCQDISLAGRGAGLDGPRSSLWWDFARLIGELRPRYVIVENVPAITSRGLDRMLVGLAARGFDAEWDHLPASAFGAPHQRDRFWLVAYPSSDAVRQQSERDQPDAAERGHAVAGDDGPARLLAGAHPDADGGRREVERLEESAGLEGARRHEPDRLRADRQQHDAAPVADAEVLAERTGLRESGSGEEWWRRLGDGGSTLAVADADEPRSQGRGGGLVDADAGRPAAPRVRPDAARPDRAGEWWAVEPDVGRVAYGVPARVHRLRALGNSLVPQIAEWIGRRIVEYEETR